MSKILTFIKQRQTFAFLSLCAVILLAGLFALYFSNSSNGSKKSSVKLGAELAYLEGTVEYRTDAASGWKTATKDLEFKEGYSLRVLETGKAILNIDDGSSVRLNKNSAVTLTSMDSDHTVVTNDKGEVYTRVVKAERLFEVKVKDTIYRSLGTAYQTINSEKQNGVEVYHSKVSIIGVNASNQVLVEQGNKYYVANLDSPDLQNKVIPVEADEIKKDDFVMWNKDQDEKVNEFKSQMGVLFDLTPPSLTVTSPKNGDKLEAGKTTVTGTAEAGAKLTVNDQNVTNNNGSFSFDLDLVDGPNGIKVVAEDASGNKTVNNLTVTKVVVVVNNPTTTPKPTAAPVTPKIKLSGTAVDKGASLTWTVTGVDVSKGFKLVKSLDANPVYPGDSATFLDSSSRQYTWKIQDGKTYHFRICQYLDGKCGVYSNDISLKMPTSQTSTSVVNSITLSAAGTKVTWTVDGTSKDGFKVVWSKNTSPTYPPRSGDQAQYQCADATHSSELNAFDGSGTYYVRVCEYLNGSCGKYSNQVQLTLSE